MASPGSQSKDRVANRPDKSQSSGGKNDPRSQDRAMQRQNNIDNGNETTPHGAPIHTSQDGLSKGISVAQGPAKWAGTKQRVKDFNDANAEYNDRDFFGKIMDVFGGPAYDENAPDINKPETYWGGKYHTSTNIPGTIGMIAGMASPIPGTGMVLSKALQYGADALGVDGDAYHHPAPEDQREKYGMAPAGGWSQAAGGKAPSRGLLSAKNQQTSQAPTNDRTSAATPSRGLIRAVPVTPQAVAPQPTTPTGQPTPPTPLPVSNNPTPTQRYGNAGYQGGWVYDPSTGQLHAA